MNKNKRPALVPDEDTKKVMYPVMWTLLEVEWREKGERRESKSSLFSPNKDGDNSTLTIDTHSQWEG